MRRLHINFPGAVVAWQKIGIKLHRSKILSHSLAYFSLLNLGKIMRSKLQMKFSTSTHTHTRSATL